MKARDLKIWLKNEIVKDMSAREFVKYMRSFE